jgi:hypothetical protein
MMTPRRLSRTRHDPVSRLPAKHGASYAFVWHAWRVVLCLVSVWAALTPAPWILRDPSGFGGLPCD